MAQANTTVALHTGGGPIVSLCDPCKSTLRATGVRTFFIDNVEDDTECERCNSPEEMAVFDEEHMPASPMPPSTEVPRGKGT